MDETPPVKKKKRCDGTRLIETHKGKYAAHLLSQGYSLRKAAALAGISNNGAEALRHWNAANKTRLEGIDSVFRDKAKIVADWAMSAITPAKLKKADAVANIRVAKEAGVIGGLITHSPVPGTGQLLVLAHFGLQVGLPSISSLDQQADRPVLEANSGTADGNEPSQDSP